MGNHVGLSPRGRGNHLLGAAELVGSRSIPAWAGEPGKKGENCRNPPVYPRVGGGTRMKEMIRLRGVGLSPRGRGNPQLPITAPGTNGSIPAWAGEPFRNAARCRYWTGLSPRGRGNRRAVMPEITIYRSIPAWAGEPSTPAISGTASSVYPRVGGGTVGGVVPDVARAGLSPRGRGNHSLSAICSSSCGSIPAWAGEPAKSLSRSLRSWVYPRVGGGTRPDAALGIPAQGLSPRGRGNQDGREDAIAPPRSIPAWAGEPSTSKVTATAGWVYPRVGGGTHVRMVRTRIPYGLSPRGRGNRRCRPAHIPSSWSIPAWAGEPGCSAAGGPRAAVYPRVGGGTVPAFLGHVLERGLSPRGRGNPDLQARQNLPARSIPAWAGEPWITRSTSPPTWVYPRVGGGTGS